MNSSSRLPILLTKKVFQEYQHALDEHHFIDHVPNKGNLVLLLNLDTEFQTQSPLDVFNPLAKASARSIVSLQVSDALNQHSKIFVHEDQVQFAQRTQRSHLIRHPIFTSECVAVDYLMSLGYAVYLRFDPQAVLAKRTITLTFCGFFLLVDLLPAFQRAFLLKVIEKIVQKKIVHQRHLKYVRNSKKEPMTLRLPFYLTLDQQPFGVVLNFLDLVGLHGKASLKDVALNVGLPMTSKNLAGNNITRMSDWYFEEPQNFDDYALGDTGLYPVLKQNCDTVRDLSGLMTAPERAITPSLTIGSTTNKMLDAKRLHYLGLERDAHRSPFYLKCLGHELFKGLDLQDHPANTLLKVDGGRCRNNAPLTSHLQGALCDLDIKGAYSSAMMALFAFFGNPTIVTFEDTSLKRVLQKYLTSLRPHHWTMRVSTSAPLSFNQDLISSFYDYKWKERKSDTESHHETGEFDHDSGAAKIFTHQIHQGTLTSDLLDVLWHTWSKPAQEEFFSKVHVLSLAFYDAAYEVEEVKDFVNHLYEHQKEANATPLNAWHKVPLKDLGIETFREERKKHPKGSPLNVMYKLSGNTAYGAIVSHFFPAHNPITANNITANIRATIYVCEKIFGFKQTITDGGLFDLNAVLTPKRKGKIYLDKLYAVPTFNKRVVDRRLDLRFSGLGGHKWHIAKKVDGEIRVTLDGNDVSLGDAHALVNRLCLETMSSTLSTLPLLKNHYLEFEMKDFLTRATFHGSSNYAFWQDKTLEALKQRGYEKKAHVAYALDERDQLRFLPVYREDFTPAHFIHEQLSLDPEHVAFAPPFLKTEILKTAQFANHFDSRSHRPILPGDNMLKMGCPKWFSLNQFTFQTINQLKHWQKTSEKLLRQYGISFELFFLNEDSTLNFTRMCQTMYDMIHLGIGKEVKDEILNKLDPYRHRDRIFKTHPKLVRHKLTIDAMKIRLAAFYGVVPETLETDLFEVQDVFDEIDEIDLK